MNLRQKLNHRLADKVPADWIDGHALAKKEGYSCLEAARHVIKGGLAAGLLETKKFRVVWGETVRARPFYRYVR